MRSFPTLGYQELGKGWLGDGIAPAGMTKGDRLALPYTFDPSSLGDGPLPSPWSGSTYSISGGVVVNSPALGAELLTDGGLEANYTAGLCDSLTKSGSPTVAQSADVHGGTKAQSFTAAAAANRLSQYIFPPVLNQWYQASVWAKVAAGTSVMTNLRLAGTDLFPPTNVSTFTAGTYTQHKAAAVAAAVTDIVQVFPVFEEGSADFPAVIVDDMSLKAIAFSSLFALLNGGRADVVAKLRTPGAYASYTDATLFGVVIRADAQISPTNFILGYVRRRQNGSTLGVAGIIKKVGATYTHVLSDTIVTLAASADIELRASGSTVSLWYNGTQVSTDQTILDAGLVNNIYHGIFSAGGNSLNRFFLSTN